MKILLAGIRPPKRLDEADSVFFPTKVEFISAGPTEEDMVTQVADVDYIICGSARITSRIISAARKLKAIQIYGTRHEKVDLDAATAKSIRVALQVKESRFDIADHVLMLILALQRRLLESHAGVIKADYKRLGIKPVRTLLSTQAKSPEVNRWLGLEGISPLDGKTLGLFGFGEIGTEVAKRARGFGLNILYFKNHRLPERTEVGLGVAYTDFQDLLKTSDFFVICVPLTKETEGAIGGKELASMKKAAFIINVARGPIIDEDALFVALRDGIIAGAGLDVFREEPLPDYSPLLTLKNVILTPHSAGGSQRRDEVIDACENIARDLNGQAMHNLLAA